MMLTKVTTTSPCRSCGCPDSHVVRVARQWGTMSEKRQCSLCGRTRWQAIEGSDEASDSSMGVVWQRVKCPKCRSTDVPVRSTADSGPPLVQYRKCRRCGTNFKSIGE